MWLSFAPIANYTAAFYGIAVGTVDWFSLAYFAVSPVVGVVAMFLLDTCGLRLPVSVFIMSSQGSISDFKFVGGRYRK